MGTLHGRDRERAALRAAAERCAGGSATLVLLGGEPGIGKTALLEDLARAGAERGFAVRWGTCWAGDGTPSGWPWQRLIPDFAELVPPGTDPGRFGHFVAVAERLRSETRTGPQLLVLDDLQWAEGTCLDLIRFVRQDLRDEPLLIAGGFRDVGTAGPAALRRLLGDSGTEVITLAGLDRAGIADLVAEGHGTVGADLLDEVETRTGGNPFLIRQLSRLGLAGLAADEAAFDAVAARLAALSPDVIAVLRSAAVAGREFETELIAAAAGLDTDRYQVLLREPVGERLVEGTGPGRHRFVHDLLRERLLLDLDPGQRRRIEHRLHDVLLELPGLEFQRRRLAAHAAAAFPDLDRETVLARADQAAAEALADHRYSDAGRILDQAQRVTGDRTAERLLQIAEARRRAGQNAGARDAFTELLGPGQPRSVRARAALGLHELGVETDTSRAPLIQLLESALADLDPAAEPALSARLGAALARELADGRHADRDRAIATVEDAVARARRQRDPAVLAACLLAQHDVIWAPGTAADRLRIAEELVRVAETAAPELAFQGALCRYVALLEQASVELHPALADVEKRAAALNQPALTYLARSRRDAWEGFVGDPGEAEAATRSTYALGRQLQIPDASGVLVTQLVCLDLPYPDAPSRLQRRRTEFGDQLLPGDFAIEDRGYALLAAGATRDAASLIEAAGTPVVRTGYRWRAVSALTLDADLAARSGSIEAAARLRDELTPFSGQLVIIGGGVGIAGPVDGYLALLCGLLGEEQAAGRYRTAAGHQLAVLNAEAWRIRLDAGPDGAPAASGVPEEAVFRRDGGVWRISYAGTAVHLPPSKGLADLAVLLAHPGAAIDALRLVGGISGAAPTELGSDAVLDATAKAAYRTRLEELDDELDTAAALADDARRLRAEQERDALIDELRRASGLGGRDRRLGDPRERARSTVTARIRETLKRIETAHPELGRHLRASIRTGRACSYSPAEPVSWRL